ncbi:MAG: GAF domain-containing protein [Magnetococcus sp. WYHC-3]
MSDVQAMGTQDKTAPGPASGGRVRDWVDRVAGLRYFAFIEVALFLGVGLVLDTWLLAQDRFWQVSPHPFWAIVLLVALQYGTREAVLTALAVSVALLVGNMPDRSIHDDEFSYLFAILHLPMMWFTAAVLLGEIRMRQIRERDSLKEHWEASRKREGDLTRAYERLQRIRDNLESRMASQMRTVVSTHRAARALDEQEPNQVIDGAVEMIRATLGPEKFSLFLLDQDRLVLRIESGWQDEEHFSREFTNVSRMFQEVVGQGRVLAVSRGDQREVLASEGVLAGPLRDSETGQVVGMMKIESLGFMDFTLSNVENFKVLCDWVGGAYANAQRFQEANADRVINPAHQLFSYRFFPRQTTMLTNLGRRLRFDVCIIIIRLVNAEGLSPERRMLIPPRVNAATSEVMRNTDMAFDYEKPGVEFVILFPATPYENMPIVRQKLGKAMASHVLSAVPEAEFHYEVKVLHQAPREAAASAPAASAPAASAPAASAPAAPAAVAGG